jgi:Patatin-like phospholipase
MKLGFSLTPGGLLLPFHMGALDALQHHKFLTPETPIAGSSAGAIAVAAHASGLDSKEIVKATIAVSDACAVVGRARGNLLPLLKNELDFRIGEEEFERVKARPGIAGIAYRELFPRNRNILQTDYASRDDLFQAVMNSCHFPFFATDWPVLLDWHNRRFPRVVVDGWFTVPRNRMGCPDFSMAQKRRRTSLSEQEDQDEKEVDTVDEGAIVDRTIAISCFPREAMGLTAMESHDCIAICESTVMRDLLRLATEPSSEKELWDLYEQGWVQAEKWCQEERAGRWEGAVSKADAESAATL